MKRFLLFIVVAICFSGVIYVASPKDEVLIAKCKDGVLSYSKHRRGACSHHGGVIEWMQPK